MILLSDRQRGRYFLVPDAGVLGEGTLALESMTGEVIAVDAAAAARYQVPEAVARAYGQEQVGALKEVFAKAGREIERTSAEARARVSELAGTGGLDEKALLERLGIDPSASPEEVLRGLLDLVARLGEEIPAAAGDVKSASERLAGLDDALTGGRRGSSRGATADLLRELSEDPDADDELRAKVAELEELARELED